MKFTIHICRCLQQMSQRLQLLILKSNDDTYLCAIVKWLQTFSVELIKLSFPNCERWRVVSCHILSHFH